MAAWDIDLTTRAGAQSGSYQASLVCFLFAGLNAVGLVLLGLMLSPKAALGNVAVTGLFAAALAQIVISLVAGLRLRQGKGFVWGLVTAALLVLALLFNLASGSLGAAGLDALLLVFLGNGLRGAHALHKGENFEDDDIEVFG